MDPSILPARPLLERNAMKLRISAPPAVQRLEARTLLSTTTDAIRLTSRGTLLVQGDIGTDVVRISRSGGSIAASIDSQTGSDQSVKFSAKDVKRIYVDAGGGRDQIFVDARVTERATLLGGTGDDTIVGGIATTTIKCGAGADRRH